MRLSRDLTVQAVDLPRIDLRRWTRGPRRIRCASGLDCVRARLRVRRALADLRPALPPLPVDPSAIHDGEVEIAVGKNDRRPRYIKLTGKADAGFLVGDVSFEVELDLPRG